MSFGSRSARLQLPAGQARHAGGWIQRGIDATLYGAANLLTDASPPISLCDAVAAAAPRRSCWLPAERSNPATPDHRLGRGGGGSDRHGARRPCPAAGPPDTRTQATVAARLHRPTGRADRVPGPRQTTTLNSPLAARPRRAVRHAGRPAQACGRQVGRPKRLLLVGAERPSIKGRMAHHR
jgi:hypothetical protein